MTFLRYLAYEKQYIYLYLISFLLVAAVFFVGSSGSFDLETLIYALILSIILLVCFFIYRFQKISYVIQQIENAEDYSYLSIEGEYLQTYIYELKNRHIREINKLQDKQKEHYDFIVSWFHEIKTPIAVLRLLQQTDIDYNSLREELAKIEGFVDQALYYAKLDSFNQDYDIQNCDIVQITKEAVKSHAKTFFSKKIRINIQAEALEVQSDPKWLQFIVNQLLTNSLKYTKAGGEITVSVVETSQEKQLVIRDNGIGISAKDLPRIFNRGFTGETGRKYPKSTGMGLYLAQSLSNKLGHYISCTSEVNAYTKFIIHFPKDNDPYLIMKKTHNE